MRILNLIRMTDVSSTIFFNISSNRTKEYRIIYYDKFIWHKIFFSSVLSCNVFIPLLCHKWELTATTNTSKTTNLSAWDNLNMDNICGKLGRNCAFKWQQLGYIHTYMHTYIYIYIHTNTHTHTRIFIHRSIIYTSRIECWICHEMS